MSPDVPFSPTEDSFRYEPYFYYALLNIPRSASHDDVCRGFREQSRLYHSDVYSRKAGEEPSMMRRQAEASMKDRFQLINEAYEVLRDTKGKRAIYDAVCEALSAKSTHGLSYTDQTIQERMEEISNAAGDMLTTQSIEGEAFKVFLYECIARKEVMRMVSLVDSPSSIEIFVDMANASDSHKETPDMRHLSNLIFNSIYRIRLRESIQSPLSDGSIIRLLSVCDVGRQSRLLETGKSLSKVNINQLDLKLALQSNDSKIFTEISFSPFDAPDQELHIQQPHLNYMASIVHSRESTVSKNLRLTKTIQLGMNHPEDSSNFTELVEISTSFEVKHRDFSVGWGCLFNLKDIFQAGVSSIGPSSQSMFDHVKRAILHQVQHQLNVTFQKRKKPSLHEKSVQWFGSIGYRHCALGVSRYSASCAPLFSQLMNGEIPFVPECTFFEKIRWMNSLFPFTKQTCGTASTAETLEKSAPSPDRKNESDGYNSEDSEPSEETLYTTFHPQVSAFDTPPPLVYPTVDVDQILYPVSSSYSEDVHPFFTRRHFGYGDFFSTARTSSVSDSLKQLPLHFRSAISSSLSVAIDFMTGKLNVSQEYVLNRWFHFWDVGIATKLSFPLIPLTILCLAKQIESSDYVPLEKAREVTQSMANHVLTPLSFLSVFQVEILVNHRQCKSEDTQHPTIRIPILVNSTSLFALSRQEVSCEILRRVLSRFTLPMKKSLIHAWKSYYEPTFLSLVENLWQCTVKPIIAFNIFTTGCGPIGFSVFNSYRCARYLKTHKKTIEKHRAFALEQQRLLFQAIGEKVLARERSTLHFSRENEHPVVAGLIIRRATYRVRSKSIFLKYAVQNDENKRRSKGRKYSHALPPLSLDVTTVLQSLVVNSRLVIHVNDTSDGKCSRRRLFHVLPGFYDIEPTGSEEKELVIEYTFMGRKHRYIYTEGGSGPVDDMICLPQEKHALRADER